MNFLNVDANDTDIFVTLVKNITPVIVAFVAGGLGSVFAPWSNWRVEKNRIKQKNRSDLITDWRDSLADLHQDVMYDSQKYDDGLQQYSRVKPRQNFARRKTLSSLYPYLDSHFWSDGMSSSDDDFCVLDDHIIIIERALKRVDEIEKEWGLV